MKIQFLTSIFATLALTYSCQKCELIEQNIVYPPKSCEGTFFINKADRDTLGFNFFLNEFNKPIPEPFIYAEGTGPQVVMADLFDFEQNLSALDTVNDEYVFVYSDFSTNPPTKLYYHQILSTGFNTINGSNEFFVCPVYWKNLLYAINAKVNNSNVHYEILSIAPFTGFMLGVVASGDFVANSGFSLHDISATADEDGFIYFLSGTNLIKLTIATNASQYIDIDPTYDPVSNQVYYYGAEFKADVKKIVAIKQAIDMNNNHTTTLVLINPSVTPVTQETVFNIGANLPPDQDNTISVDFYSTTFDQCDNTYYITEPRSVNPLLTNLTEINLNLLTLKSTVIPGIEYGIEYRPGN
jgi:hypothetical protein